jgi:hypothetical protein
VDFRELFRLSLYLSPIPPVSGFLRARHSVGRFRGSVACTGFWWLLVACPLLGCFGRLGVGESVAVGRVLPYRWRSGLPLSANSQESLSNLDTQKALRKLSGLFCLRMCLRQREFPNSASECPSEREFPNFLARVASDVNFPKRYLTSDGRWGSLVFTASVPSRAQGTQTSLLGARIPVRNWGFYLGVSLT